MQNSKGELWEGFMIIFTFSLLISLQIQQYYFFDIIFADNGLRNGEDSDFAYLVD